MKKLDPYYDSEKDRLYADKDPDNKWHYVHDITEDLQLNGMAASGVIAIPDRMTITKQPTIETETVDGVLRTYLKVQVTGPTAAPTAGQDDASYTLRVTCDNDDVIDFPLYFKWFG
jgi:hypothetical protein